MRPGFWFMLIVAAAISLTNLGTARLWDRDEPRNAQCAREMLDAGNWVVPTFDGQLRTHKPILIYWAQIASYKLFGVNEFAARLPSALAGIATILLVYWIAIRLGFGLGGSEIAAWSGTVLATMILFVMSERAATPDALLIATTTLAIALFVRFAFPDRALQFCWPNRWQWTAVYAACGLAVLAKGPVGLVMPIAVIGSTTLMIARKPDSRCRPSGFYKRTWHAMSGLVRDTFIHGLRMRPVLAIGVVLLVAGPWYLAVGLATDGVWLREFFLTHNISRAVSTMEGHSGPPILFYVGALLVGTFPWSCFAIPVGLAVWSRWKDQRSTGLKLDPLLVLGLCWMVVYIGVFSLASTKLPSYITPCHPGLALIVGWYVSETMRDRVAHPRWHRAGLAVAFLIGVGIFAALVGPVGQRIETLKPLAFAGIIFAVAGVMGVGLASRRRPGLAMRTFVIGSVSLVWILHALGPAAVDRQRTDLDALQTAFRNDPERVWWISGSPEPSWVFYSGGGIRMGSPLANVVAQERIGIIERLDTPARGAIPMFLEDRYLSIRPLPPKEVARVAVEVNSDPVQSNDAR